jgi:hypothetical protein
MGDTHKPLSAGEKAAIDRSEAKAATVAENVEATEAAKKYDPRLSEKTASVATIKGGPRIADYPGADSGNMTARARYDKAVRDYKRDHAVVESALDKVNK